MNEKQMTLAAAFDEAEGIGGAHTYTYVDRFVLAKLRRLALELLADPMPREELASKIEDIVYDAVEWNCDGECGECRVNFNAVLGAVRRVVNALLDGTEIK